MASRQQNIQTVTNAAYAIGYPVELALAQAQRESGFNDRAVGGDGERGLMQPLPSTWRDVMPGVSFDSAFDPETNLVFWQRYLGQMLSRFGYDYRKALTAYNGGPGVFSRPAALRQATGYADAILSAAGWGSGQSTIPTATAIPTNADASQPFDETFYDGTPTGSGLILPIAIGAVLLFFILTGD